MSLLRLTTLLLVGSLVMPLHSQGLNSLHTEKNPFKYIPKGETFFYNFFTFDYIENKIFTIYWYDKNRNEKVEKEEMFIDVNEDCIPDMILTDFMKWYSSERSKKILEKTSV